MAQPTKIIFDSPASVAGNIDYDNQFIDHFYGGRNIYQVDGINSSISHAGFVDLNNRYNDTTTVEYNFAIDSTFIDSTYHDAFIFKYNSGDPFPKFVEYLQGINYFYFYDGRHYAGVYDTTEQELNSLIGFWINTNDLNGNGIIFRNIGGGTYIVNGSNIITKGYENDLWIVFKVVGDYTYLKFKLYNSIYSGTPYFRMSIFPSSANEVTQLTIYNPTLIYSKSINPYKRYTSQAEKDTSLFIGKRIIYVGDSQYNDGYFHVALADSTGANIVDEHYGGYRMTYSATSWFYQDSVKNKVFTVPDVDLYFFPISSNDGNGGGDTLDSSIDSVIYYYPYYGDHPDTITAKLARFAALSESRKISIFQFQQTYCAYIQQIKLVNPTARIIIGSVPIGAGSGTMTGDTTELGYGIWQAPYSPEERILNWLPTLENTRAEIIEVSEKYDTEFIDIMNLVDLDFYNFHQYCFDGVHWYPEIKIRIASLLKDYLK